MNWVWASLQANTPILPIESDTPLNLPWNWATATALGAAKLLNVLIGWTNNSTQEMDPWMKSKRIDPMLYAVARACMHQRKNNQVLRQRIGLCIKKWHESAATLLTESRREDVNTLEKRAQRDKINAHISVLTKRQEGLIAAENQLANYVIEIQGYFDELKQDVMKADPSSKEGILSRGFPMRRADILSRIRTSFPKILPEISNLVIANQWKAASILDQDYVTHWKESIAQVAPDISSPKQIQRWLHMHREVGEGIMIHLNIKNVPSSIISSRGSILSDKSVYVRFTPRKPHDDTDYPIDSTFRKGIVEVIHRQKSIELQWQVDNSAETYPTYIDFPALEQGILRVVIFKKNNKDNTWISTPIEIFRSPIETLEPYRKNKNTSKHQILKTPIICKPEELSAASLASKETPANQLKFAPNEIKALFEKATADGVPDSKLLLLASFFSGKDETDEKRLVRYIRIIRYLIEEFSWVFQRYPGFSKEKGLQDCETILAKFPGSILSNYPELQHIQSSGNSSEEPLESWKDALIVALYGYVFKEMKTIKRKLNEQNLPDKIDRIAREVNA